ncbi:uncharacterized protein EI90DRAFT_3013194 [Cantharellus anzutake]|uniref:uncharacterized protein n=1 Tax=Cantharellus anzutake TaxID=1750568 RepID=UPI001904707F|nr:uncharacterized protein EI90DRAFT_3013194 [Cantharellus anzutake]KAF8339145.1 hypothetical protein EI90DRAFT_3013194 [Cantharellus anzutake]
MDPCRRSLREDHWSARGQASGYLNWLYSMWNIQPGFRGIQRTEQPDSSTAGSQREAGAGIDTVECRDYYQEPRTRARMTTVVPCMANQLGKSIISVAKLRGVHECKGLLQPVDHLRSLHQLSKDGDACHSVGHESEIQIRHSISPKKGDADLQRQNHTQIRKV